MTDTPYFEDERLKRLYYISQHRGCKETDYILGGFANKHLSNLTPQQLNDYEALLAEDDWDIYAWIIGKHPVPEGFDTEVFQVIKQHTLNK